MAKAGRPKKKLSSLPEGWQQKILDIYSDGGCDVEVRSYLGGMSDDLFYRLLEEEPEFSRTIKRGRVHAEAWWRKAGRQNLGAGIMNTGLYAIQMRNRFGWKDRNESDKDKENALVVDGINWEIVS